MKAAVDADPLISVIFICSPGNPTGTLIDPSDIKQLLEYKNYKGVVIVDEAYIDFARVGDKIPSMATFVESYPNLIVLQTLSKSFGLAGIRLGVSISSPEIASIFNKTKAPYNISVPTSILANTALSADALASWNAHINELNAQKEDLMSKIVGIPDIGSILGGNHANFILVEILGHDGKPCNDRAFAVYKEMAEKYGIVVRFRGSELGCEGCLRITIGTKQENAKLLQSLEDILSK